MTETRDFLGFRFACGSRAELAARIVAMGNERYGFVTTPNVDFVTRADRDPAIKALYQRAALQICDSRILTRLASLRGIALDCYPGSDFVADLFASHSDQAIAIIGPSKEDWRTLVDRFPTAKLTFIESPAIMSQGDDAWSACLESTAQQDWDILLICLGSPKQERFAADLAERYDGNGVALCVGASIDFLTDRQRRAPGWMRAAGLEWAHRLASNPRRLWRRYIIDNPKVFRIFLTSLVATRP